MARLDITSPQMVNQIEKNQEALKIFVAGMDQTIMGWKDSRKIPLIKDQLNQNNWLIVNLARELEGVELQIIYRLVHLKHSLNELVFILTHFELTFVLK